MSAKTANEISNAIGEDSSKTYGHIIMPLHTVYIVYILCIYIYIYTHINCFVCVCIKTVCLDGFAKLHEPPQRNGALTLYLGIGAMVLGTLGGLGRAHR